MKTTEQPCPEREYRSNRQCERPLGHEGAHMIGTDPGSNLVVAWPVFNPRGTATAVTTAGRRKDTP